MKFTQDVKIISEKPDRDGFSKATFNIVTQKSDSNSSQILESSTVEGLVFDDYGIHTGNHYGDKHIKITNLPSGCLIASLAPRVGGVRERKAIAKRMIKRFPLSVPGGIVRTEIRTYQQAGEQREYIVHLAIAPYDKDMSRIIAEELKGAAQLGRMR